MKHGKLSHIGLFEGIGGFSLAARWMGWETVAWCEWDEFCQKVLKHHFPEAEQYGDITKTDFTGYSGQIDVLTGGFPCQPYSSAGKRLGKEDDRHLWPEMLRAIREIQPRWVVGENVRGLTNWNGGLVFDEVQADLENEGYEVTPYLLPACAVNAPHRRDRIWFIAYNTNKKQFCSEPGVWQRPNYESERVCNEFATDTKQGGRRKILHDLQEGQPNGGISYCACCKWDAANTNSTGLSEWIQSGFGGISTPAGTFKGCESSRRDTANDWAEFPTQSPICSRNDGISNRLDGITFPKWREKSIGAYGNAIVPQVALQIFKAIQELEK